MRPTSLLMNMANPLNRGSIISQGMLFLCPMLPRPHLLDLLEMHQQIIAAATQEKDAIMMTNPIEEYIDKTMHPSPIADQEIISERHPPCSPASDDGSDRGQNCTPLPNDQSSLPDEGTDSDSSTSDTVSCSSSCACRDDASSVSSSDTEVSLCHEPPPFTNIHIDSPLACPIRLMIRAFTMRKCPAIKYYTGHFSWSIQHARERHCK